ncbi:hypothetical protein IJ556_00315 [bacterium]|nr:hypothetical protein [bacterium]
MGLSSSQSRFLTLTARLSDLELKAQSIQHQKIRLAEQSTDASKKYMDALNAQTMKFNSVDYGKVDASIKNITASLTYRVATNKDGIDYFYSQGTDGKWYLVNKNNENDKQAVSDGMVEKMSDAAWLLEQLESANLFIQKYSKENGYWEDYSYVSSSVFTTDADNAEVARSEAEYEYTMAEIQQKDKRFDLDLDNINTEHSAVDTEMDSVKSVVDKNIDKTFQVFS